jgi:NADH-quinone oxidoreductase subunit N
MPFAAAAVIFGGLSLAAVPITAGFPGRWALYRLLAVDDLGLAFILLIASVSVTLAYARGIAALFRRESAAEEAATEKPREGQVAMVYLAIGVGTIILLGVFPQLLLPAVARAAEVFVK